jgi:50S ribosomal protein L16 3-hydroxylase
MIANWLRQVTPAQFRAEHFQRAPLAEPETARRAIRLLTWDVVARLVEANPDMLLVRNGKLRRDPNPATFAEALTLFREGFSLVLRRCERHDPALRELADAVGAELEGDVAIQAYITPGGFHSFGWHYDCEDVFIVQTLGTKEYLLRRNTVNPFPTLDAMPRDMHYERETTPTVAATLVPGDLLYVPRGWWHVARAEADSLSISIGVLSPAAAAKSGIDA